MTNSLKKAIAAVISAAVIVGSAMAVPASALETKAVEADQSPVVVSFPSTDEEKTVIGNNGIEITGTAPGESSLRLQIGGKFFGTVEVAADGSFTAKLGSFQISSGLNDIELVPASGKPAAELSIRKKNYYDVADLNYTTSGAAEFFAKTGVSKYCPSLSMGGQVLKTTNGFSVVPGDGVNAQPADVNIDLTAIGSVEYFHALVGIDDFANIAGAVTGSVKYSVLADGVELAKTHEVTLNETVEIEADVPRGARTLTLRVDNSNGTNHSDYADWVDARLFAKKSDYNSEETELFDASNSAVITAKGSVGVRLNVRNDFSAITLRPEKANETVYGRLYKFTYSYLRSMQNGDLCEVAATADQNGNYKFELNNLYGPGEYLFVADGVTEIQASKEDNAYVFADGASAKGVLNMTVTFSGKNANCLDTVTEEPEASSGIAQATDAEKSRAKETYTRYITNLENFPSKMTIGDKEYVGFSDKDFTELSRKTEKNETTKSENTNIEILHKSGLKFTLKTVFYPDYAAFDWVIYFTNITSAKSPNVSEISPAELTFEGENPIILTNCGDSESITGMPAPYTPRSYSLEETPDVTFEPTNGRSAEAAFPYYNLEYGDKGAFVVTSWAGQWKDDFSYADGKTTFSGRQEIFNSYIKPGEIARTPLTAVILYDGRDTDRATNLWRRWFIDCNMFKKDGQNNLEPFVAGVTSAVFNEMMGATEQSQIDYIEKYFNIGVELDLWWMDAGWYEKGGLPGNGGKGWDYVGGWTVDQERFPTKFKNVSEAAKAHDMITLLWFEPERVAFSLSSSDFETYGIKREWLVGYDADRNSALGPNGYRMFNLGNPEALDFMINRINSVLNEGGISFYREDLNTGSIRAIWRSAETDPDRQGMLENSFVQGHYALWDGILANENIQMIDSCASGGHRLDLETMRRAVALHPTDYNYNDMPAKHQGSYGLASWLPFAGANTGTGGNVTDTSKYNMRSAYRQAMILQFNVDSLSAEKQQIVASCEKEWRGISTYFYDDIYQLTNNTASANEWYSYGYMNSEDQSGFALVFRHFGANAPESQNIRLKGLNKNDIYEITFADSDAVISGSGAELMSVGVPVTLAEKELDDGSDSEVIYIRRTSSAVMYGDVDGNEKVTVDDALSALQAAVGKITLDDDAKVRSDVDKTEGVSVNDALLILQYAVGKINIFPIEQ